MAFTSVEFLVETPDEDVFLTPDGPDHFTVRTDVIVSPQFFAWVLGFGGSAEIIGPAEVVEGIRAHIESAAEKYR